MSRYNAKRTKVLPPTVAKIKMTKPKQAIGEISVDANGIISVDAILVCSKTEKVFAVVVAAIASVNVRLTL